MCGVDEVSGIERWRVQVAGRFAEIDSKNSPRQMNFLLRRGPNGSSDPEEGAVYCPLRDTKGLNSAPSPDEPSSTPATTRKARAKGKAKCPGVFWRELPRIRTIVPLGSSNTTDAGSNDAEDNTGGSAAAPGTPPAVSEDKTDKEHPAGKGNVDVGGFVVNNNMVQRGVVSISPDSAVPFSSQHLTHVCATLWCAFKQLNFIVRVGEHTFSFEDHDDWQRAVQDLQQNPSVFA